MPRIADENLHPNANEIANMGGQRCRLGGAVRLVGVFGPCFDDQAHDVEPVFAAQLDLIMRAKAAAT